MNGIFLGVDIAGASNTWICALSHSNFSKYLNMYLYPQKATLSRILQYAEDEQVIAVAIDAQLTSSIEDENGFRSSDLELRNLLPEDCRNWVASQNSLMAVPVRGRQLAEALSPIVGTIIETHPRACIYFANTFIYWDLVKDYKKLDAYDERQRLFSEWEDQFRINLDYESIINTDGAFDALVCATVAYLYHDNQDKLYKLKYNASNKTGRGPFYIIKPESLKP